ncbi:MAG: LON peptidase substrate-binding domain-containing protein, partial [Clostridia bacterium]|nr:LON peptidase substrate-binding domain-containing protein [Clostridia bacterium]
MLDNEQIINTMEEKVFPLVALRGKILFPKTFLNFDVGRPASIKAIDAASKCGSVVFIASQKSAFIDNPKKGDIYKTGTLCKIKQILKLPN